jgi:hypothetical protein
MVARIHVVQITVISVIQEDAQLVNNMLLLFGIILSNIMIVFVTKITIWNKLIVCVCRIDNQISTI